MIPEEALITAIITQAVHDLEDKDDNVRHEARLFCFGTGVWATSRERLCAAVGIDVNAMQEQLRAAGKYDKIETPTADRRFNPFTEDDLLALIPDEEFMLRDLGMPESVNLVIAYERVCQLIKRGVVEKIGHSSYALTSLHLVKDLGWRERIFATLTVAPQSTLEISRAFSTKPTQDLVHGMCTQLVTQGLAKKTAPATFALVPNSNRLAT